MKNWRIVFLLSSAIAVGILLPWLNAPAGGPAGPGDMIAAFITATAAGEPLDIPAAILAAAFCLALLNLVLAFADRASRLLSLVTALALPAAFFAHRVLPEAQALPFPLPALPGAGTDWAAYAAELSAVYAPGAAVAAAGAALLLLFAILGPAKPKVTGYSQVYRPA